MLRVLTSILGGLLVGWILSLFGADVAVINVFQPLFTTVTLTSQHYFVAFGLLGLILGVFASARRR